jgi:DNA mismatch repair protein MutS2
MEEVARVRSESVADTPANRDELSIAEGMTVYLKGLERPAQVVNVDGNRVRVMAGSISLDVALADVEPAPDEPVAPLKTVVRVPTRQTSLTLDIIGQRAEEARNSLEKYLDDAILSGLSRVRIIHGSGAGVLRRVVDEVLRDHDQVVEYGVEMDAPGGTGVTWVVLEGAPA